MTKEEIIEKHANERVFDNLMTKTERVVIDKTLAAMQEYADQETASLKAENERLRGLIKQMWYKEISTGFDHLFDKETRDYWFEKFKTENNL